MNVLALDPGLRNPAAAFFRAGVLVSASRVRVPSTLHALPVGERCRQVAHLVAEWALVASEGSMGELTLVTEWPRVYRAGRSKGDPADLIPLAGVGMCLAGLLDCPVVSPTPAEWIGQLPKSLSGDPTASARGLRIWSRLSVEERGRVVLSHDAVDAVGIGLHHLGRLGVRRAYASG